MRKTTRGDGSQGLWQWFTVLGKAADDFSSAHLNALDVAWASAIARTYVAPSTAGSAVRDLLLGKDPISKLWPDDAPLDLRMLQGSKEVLVPLIEADVELTLLDEDEIKLHDLNTMLESAAKLGLMVPELWYAWGRTELELGSLDDVGCCADGAG